eukprot:s779_g9.t1
MTTTALLQWKVCMDLDWVDWAARALLSVVGLEVVVVEKVEALPLLRCQLALRMILVLAAAMGDAERGEGTMIARKSLQVEPEPARLLVTSSALPPSMKSAASSEPLVAAWS